MDLTQILSVCGVSGIISGLVGVLIAVYLKRPLEKRVKENEDSQKKQQEQSKAIMLGVQALLRDRLLQGFRHYIAQGWAAYDDRANMENLYVQYEALGPNSVMDQLHSQFIVLPEQPTEGGTNG